MASKFLIDIDLNGNEIQNFGIQTTGTLPSSPFNGQTVNHSGVIKVYETSSTSWKYVGMAADGTTITETSGVISVGTIPQSSVTDLVTDLGGKVDDSQVLTDVPVGAVFTDTTYTASSGIDLTGTNFTADSTVVRTTGAQSIGGNKTFDNNVIVTGDLTVNGTTTTVNTETINLADNIITLNSNETGTPSENGGIEVERGTSANSVLRFNESTDRWEFTNDGSTYQNIPLASEYSTTNDIDYVDSASFATGTGILTLSGVGNAGATVDLDGRYLESQSNDFGTIEVAGHTSIDAASTGATLELDAGTNMAISTSGSVVTFDATNDNDIDYISAASFNSATGVITGTGTGNAGFTVDIDGRYLTSYTESNDYGTIAVSGQTSVSASATGDTVTYVAGGGMTITTGTDEVTFTSANDNDIDYISGATFSSGTLSLTGVGNAGASISLDGRYLTAESDGFKTISVSGEDNVVADSATDTLTLVGGTGISITTDAATDAITFVADGVTDEEVEDIVGAMLTGNTETGITVTYQDSTGDIDFVNRFLHHTVENASYGGGSYSIDADGIGFEYNDEAIMVQVYDISTAVTQQVATNVTVNSSTGEVLVDLPAGDYRIALSGIRA